MQVFSMVGSYMENLEKPRNHQNWGVSTCTAMGASLGQYGMYGACMCASCTLYKLDVDLTPKKDISVAVWIHPGLGSGPPPFDMD